MAADPISVQEVFTRIKQRADIEKSGSAGVCSDAEVLNLLNLHYRKLHGEIQKMYENYTATYYNIQTVVNQLRYPLPKDFYKLLSVGIVDSVGASPNTFTALEHWNFNDQNVPGTGFLNFTNGYYTQMRFRIVGRNLELRPVKSVQLLGIWYSPSPVTLGMKDSLPEWVLPGWEEYIVCGAAMMIAAKEQALVTVHQQILQMVSDQVKSFVPNRDSFKPELVSRAWRHQRNWPGNGFGDGFGGVF